MVLTENVKKYLHFLSLFFFFCTSVITGQVGMIILVIRMQTLTTATLLFLGNSIPTTMTTPFAAARKWQHINTAWGQWIPTKLKKGRGGGNRLLIFRVLLRKSWSCSLRVDHIHHHHLLHILILSVFPMIACSMLLLSDMYLPLLLYDKLMDTSPKCILFLSEHSNIFRISLLIISLVWLLEEKDENRSNSIKYYRNC